MKALALTQPWASLIAVGAKKIETRSWGTGYRGPVAIYAAKNLEPIGGESALPGFCYQEPFRQALFGDAWYPPGRVFDLIPRGAIVATAELADVIQTEDVLGEDIVREGAFGDYTPGRKAWLLFGVRAIEPVELPKGAVRDFRGLWDVPPAIAALCSSASTSSRAENSQPVPRP